MPNTDNALHIRGIDQIFFLKFIVTYLFNFCLDLKIVYKMVSFLAD